MYMSAGYYAMMEIIQKMSDESSIRHVKVQLQVIQQKKKIYRAVHRAYPV